MYDKQLTLDVLHRIEETLDEITVWTEHVGSEDDLVKTPEGMILLNAVCMKLLAVGEEVKALDRRTNGILLSKYEEIPWKEVMGLRDIIAHHYFEVDAGEIFTVLKVDIPPLIKVVHKMIKDI